MVRMYSFSQLLPQIFSLKYLNEFTRFSIIDRENQLRLKKVVYSKVVD